MTKDINTQLLNLKDKVIFTLDALKSDPQHDFKPLLENYKQILNELRTEKNENNIHSIVPSGNEYLNDLIALRALICEDKSLYEFKPEITKNFIELKQIIKSVKKNQFEELLHFINVNQIKGELLFLYQATQFLKLIMENKSIEAILYAKNNEILALDDTCHERLKKYLPLVVLKSNSLKEYNILIHSLIKKDLLETGTDNINTLLNLEWTQENDSELPIELVAGSKYHSMFICPILKVLCESNNPPMRLKCGHVISKNAVERLVKDRHVGSFKCPYCPYDCTIEDVKQINM